MTHKVLANVSSYTIYMTILYNKNKVKYIYPEPYIF